ncbi:MULTISPECIES: type IV pilin protein [Pseudomonas]
MQRMQSGLSLIEVLIVAALVGMLAGIAYPSYSEMVRKAARTEIAGILYESAQHLEQHHSRTGRYLDSDAAVVPLPDGSAHYSLHARREADSYLLSATRRPGGSMAFDACGDFELDHRGVRANPGSSTEAGDACWGG